MKKALLVAGASVLVFFSWVMTDASAAALEEVHHDAVESRAIAQIAASREIALAVAPIKSARDLSAFVSSNKAPESNPLLTLTPRGRKRFFESLRFSPEGLSSFNYAVLESELTASEAYKVLALFGMQHITPRLRNLKTQSETDRLILRAFGSDSDSEVIEGDFKEYYCHGHGTCRRSADAICTSRC